MTRIVSTVNLKGGSGKTLMTVALAEFLAEEDRYHVLVVDVDPQTSATVSLISQQEWQRRNESGRTLAQLFKDRINGTNEFNMDRSVIRNVSNIHNGINELDLLPSSIDLLDLQDRLALIPFMSFYHVNPVKALEEAIDPFVKKEKYDYVLIDCPPNLGLLTQNALKISDSYLISAIPDILSSSGIPHILDFMRRFENTLQAKVMPLGIVLSKVRQIGTQYSIASELENRAKKGEYPRIWDTRIREIAMWTEAMDIDAQFEALRQKYGYGGYYEVYRDLKNEFIRLCPLQ